MKSLLVLCATLAVAAAVYEQLAKVEVEPIVSNPELLRSFVECFLDKATCNEQTGLFESVHGEILDTRCGYCSPKLQHSVRRFYEELPRILPEKWVHYRQRFGDERVDALFATVANV